MSADSPPIPGSRDGTARDGLLRDVLDGLARQPKSIPSKYFYDARGSELFERICAQPEYYLTRAETEILEGHGADIAAAVGPRPLVLEYGSGSGVKTRRLLQALQQPVAYVPVEISRSALADSVAELGAAFPDIEMLPVYADFSRPVTLPDARAAPARVLVFFPGSTIGNFAPRDAQGLLKVMREDMGASGLALVGIDLQKDPAMLEAAYNDAAGVTAAFTLNLLLRINRELDADFDVARFAHRARYDAAAGRIETHIVSRQAQRVQIDGHVFAFAAGETIHVEYSHKYTIDAFAGMASAVGLRVKQHWCDREERFAAVLLEVA